MQEYPKIGIREVIFSYWQIVKSVRFWLFLTLFGSIVPTIIDIFVPLQYRNFFNILAGGGDRTILAPALIKIIIIVLVLNVAEWLATRIGQIGIDRFESIGSTRLRQNSFEYLIDHSYTFFANNFTGSLTQKIGRLARAYERLTDRITFNIIPLSIRIIGTMIIVFTINLTIGWVMVGWMIVFLNFNYFFARFKLKYSLEKAAADTRASAVLSDNITNHNTIQLFTGQKIEGERYRDVTNYQLKIGLFVANLDAVMDGIQALLMIGMEFFLFYFSIRLWTLGQISLGTFVLFQTYVLGLGYRMWDFSRVIRDFYEGFADAKEMIEILELPHEIQDIPNAKKLKITTGEVKFENVSFQFDQNRPVLSEINLLIHGGEKIAIIGPSGAGKSTFVRLLLRLYNIVDGKILIDNQDIQSVSQNSLHHNISLVPQDPILFHRTLMENIRYGRRDATDDEVITAAKLAHCDEFIEVLPKKYETYVGERGIKLSGGERQRVAIARAILKNAPVLVLDEATSSLDSHSESLIQDALEKLMKNKTTIVIAHRLSTIQKMDRIIVLKDGEIVEDGSHQELLRKDGGLYQKLWTLQAGGFLVGDDEIATETPVEEDEVESMA
jgi:ATP-binding cassette subfamily B protein